MGNSLPRRRNLAQSATVVAEYALKSSDVKVQSSPSYTSLIKKKSIDHHLLYGTIELLKNEIPKANVDYVEQVLRDLIVVSFEKDEFTTRLLTLSWTAGLMCASAHGQENILELFLKYGQELNLTQSGHRLDPNKRENKYKTIGALPCGRSSYENLVSECPTCRLRLHLQDRRSNRKVGVHSHRQGVTPLHITVNADNIECSKLLIKRGADVNACDDRGMLPICYAAKRENGRMFKLLLNAGSNLLARSLDKKTILHHAVSTFVHRSGFTTKQYILQKIFNSSKGKFLEINHADSMGDTALHIAARNSNPSAVLYLIGKGACADIPNKQNQTAFQLFISFMGYLCYNRIQIICELLKTMNRINLRYKPQDWVPRILRPVYQKRTEQLLFAVLQTFINQPFSLQLLCKRVIKQNVAISNGIKASGMSTEWLGLRFDDYDENTPEFAIKECFPDNPHWQLEA